MIEHCDFDLWFLRTGEIYRLRELKNVNVKDGELFVSDVQWFWTHKDWEIQRKCVKSTYGSLEVVEIYRMLETVRCLWVTSNGFECIKIAKYRENVWNCLIIHQKL